MVVPRCCEQRDHFASRHRDTSEAMDGRADGILVECVASHGSGIESLVVAAVAAIVAAGGGDDDGGVPQHAVRQRGDRGPGRRVRRGLRRVPLHERPGQGHGTHNTTRHDQPAAARDDVALVLALQQPTIIVLGLRWDSSEMRSCLLRTWCLMPSFFFQWDSFVVNRKMVRRGFFGAGTEIKVQDQCTHCCRRCYWPIWVRVTHGSVYVCVWCVILMRLPFKMK